MKLISSHSFVAVFFIGLTLLAAGRADLAAQASAFSPTASPAVPSEPELKLDPNILAEAGNAQIKTDDIRHLLSGLDPKQRDALARNPELLKKTVGSLIIQQLVLKEALSKGWDQQPQVIAELKRVREDAIIQSYLQSISHPPADFPTPAELQSVYDANKKSLVVPRQFRLAQIFVYCPQNADAATVNVAKAKLDAIIKNLQQPDTDFAAIARTESDDKQSAAQDGELGWITEDQIQSEIRAQVPALAKGAVSQPLRLKDGWHFLKVLDVKDAHTPSLDEIHDQLVTQLRTQKAQAISQAYVLSLLRQNALSINQEALAGLLKKD